MSQHKIALYCPHALYCKFTRNWLKFKRTNNASERIISTHFMHIQMFSCVSVWAHIFFLICCVLTKRATTFFKRLFMLFTTAIVLFSRYVCLLVGWLVGKWLTIARANGALYILKPCILYINSIYFESSNLLFSPIHQVALWAIVSLHVRIHPRKIICVSIWIAWREKAFTCHNK